MRGLLIASLLVASSAIAGPTAKSETKTGYLTSNGRCDSFGIQFSEKAKPDPVVADGRICVVFPELEKLAIPDDAKREAIRAMTGKHVKVTYTAPDKATIKVTAVELVK